MRLDGTFGEHICLAFQVLIFVKDFKGAKQIIGAVIDKGKCISSAVD